VNKCEGKGFAPSLTGSPARAEKGHLVFEEGVMKATIQSGMVNVDSKEFAYANIRNIYKDGAGSGLQLNENLEHKRGELLDILNDISDKFYALEDALKR
jgi:hypothetical protein